MPHGETNIKVECALFMKKALICYHMRIKIVPIYSELMQYHFVYDKTKWLTTIYECTFRHVYGYSVKYTNVVGVVTV
jgi:hypothetical protein